MLDLIQRFDPDEPRDETGKWTDGGGGSGSSDSAPTSFISPNVSTLTFDEAVQALDGERQKQILAASKEIDEGLGIKSENHPAIGAWSDGAENSLMVVAPGASAAQIRVASAMKGYIADQKAVLTFMPNATGSDFLASFPVQGNASDVHDQLLKAGLAFHTLQPHGDSIIVHAYGSDQDAIDAVHKAATSFGADPEFIQGDGEFIGTKKEDGTDREQRDDARQQYEKVIEAARVSSELEEHDVAALWNSVRDRWSAGSAGDSAGQQADSAGSGRDSQARSVDVLRAREPRDPKVPKMFRQMTLAEASRTLPPKLFRKYYLTACAFFDANKHLERNIDDLVIVVREWDESKHPRVPAGSPDGGEFGEGGGGGGDSDSDTSASGDKPKAATPTKYGLTPGDAEKFDKLKLEWSSINNELGKTENLRNPGGPEVAKLMLQQAEVSKEINALHADPGDATGIYRPGGPRDTVIIGAGPGGMGAAINGALEGLDTMVIESQLEVGGQAKYSSRIENFPGFPIGVSGEQLTQNMLTQAERLGAEVNVGVRATEMTFDDDGMKHIKLSNGETIDTRTVIIGGGIEFRKVKFPGSEGSGVILGSAKELAAETKGKIAIVVGGSNGASQAALLCSENCDHVYVLSRSPIANGMSAYQVYGLKANPKITVIENDEIKELERDEKGNPQEVITKKGQKLPLAAVGIFAGGVPETKWVSTEVSRDYKSKDSDTARLRTNTDLEVLDDLGDPVPGVFAVGDMRDGAIGRILTAASEGQIAVKHAQAHLEKIREAAGLAPKPKAKEKADAPKKTAQKAKPFDKMIDDILALDLDNPWFGQTVDDQPPPTPTDVKKKSVNELETRGSKKTVVELWPETGESRQDFMERCTADLTKCIGAKKAPGVCGTKWRKSEKVGKKKPDEKSFVARGLADDEAIEACGATCVGCDGADAPFDLRAFDPDEPRDPAGKWTDSGGSDDELGSMALGGEDRHITPSTRKVDALRDEMGVTEADVPFEQRQALDMYTQDSTSFNQYARLGPGPSRPETEHLDTLVSRYETPRDMTVYRTVGWQRTKEIASHVGDAFSDPGFMSTTLDKSRIDKPGSYIEIQIPKGSHAFPIGSLSSFPEEAEIVFPRNSRLEIVSHEPRTENTERFVARLLS